MSAVDTTAEQAPEPTPDEKPGRRAWLRRPDPVAIGCFLVAVVVYCLQGFQGALERDAALYVYGGQRFAEGSLPYVDVVNRAGPLAHAIPGLGVIAARIVDGDDLMGVRVLFMLLSALSVAAAYVLGRDISRSRLVGVLSAGALLTFEAFSFYATVGPREKTAMVLFTTWALIAATRQRWLAAGVWIALGTLTWQPVFFGIGAAVAAAIVVSVPVRAWWRAALRVAIGGAIPTAITLAAYAVAGQLRAFIDCFLLINARYTSQSSPMGELSHSWQKVVNGYGWSVWLFAGGLVAAVVLAVLALLRPGTSTRAERGGAVALGVFVVGSVAWTMRAFDNWPDTMLLVPAAAVGAGGLVGLVVRRLSARVALGVTAVLTAAAVAAAVGYSLDHQYTGLHRERAISHAALDVLPDATVLAIEAPQPLALTNTQNISRFQLYANGMTRYVRDTWPGGLKGYVRHLQAQHPTLIAIGRPQHKWAARLTDGYVRVSQDRQWSWWVAETVPTEQRDAIVAAVDAANERYGSIATW